MIITKQIPNALLIENSMLKQELEASSYFLASGCRHKRAYIEPEADDCEDGVEIVEDGDFFRAQSLDCDDYNDPLNCFDIIGRFYAV